MKKTFLLFLSLFAITVFSPAFSQTVPYYFENPEIFSSTTSECTYPSSVNSSSKNGAVLFWQESTGSSLQIACSSTQDGIKWSDKKVLSQDIIFSGTVPLVYSVSVNKSGTIVCAILKEEGCLEFISSRDTFASFEKSELNSENESFIAPRIFTLSNGSFILFVSSGIDENFGLKYSVSKDGLKWSEFSILNTDSIKAYNPVVPFVCGGNKTDVLVFIAQHSQENHYSFQLYSSASKDGGKTWAQPSIITSDSAFEEPGKKFFNYSNQSPFIFYSGGKFNIVWERSPFNLSNADIYFSTLDNNGKIISKAEKISSAGFCSSPSLFEYKGMLHALWFTNQNENEKVYLVRSSGNLWEENEVIARNNITLPCAIITSKGNDLAFAWEKLTSKKIKQIEIQTTDHSVAPPKITAENFKSDVPVNKENFKAKVSLTPDSSNVKGFSWIFTDDENEMPPLQVRNLPENVLLSASAKKDGTWYFKVRQTDFAGNWSDAASISCIFDKTPPEKVKLHDIPLDENGLIESNTFTLNWDEAYDENDVAGYSWNLKFIDSIPKVLVSNKYHPIKIDGERIQQETESLLDANYDALGKDAPLTSYVTTRNTEASFYNYRNGLYLFSVAAVDKAGNLGEVYSTEIILNKYIPSTYITKVEGELNSFGDAVLKITGGGFTYDGKITELYLDKDGTAPYDYVLKLENNDYKIQSNNEISDINIFNIESGVYKIALLHSDRGLYLSPDKYFNVKEYGTVKNQLRHVFVPLWKSIQNLYKNNVNISVIVMILIFIFAILGIIFSSKNLISTAKETIQVRLEVKALIQGDIMPLEKKSKAVLYEKKGLSLKAKLILNTTCLIAFMDILIFLAFGLYMSRTQQETLTSSLKERVNVMLDSLESGTKAYLPTTTSFDNLNLTDIVNQSDALSESNYATILGMKDSSLNEFDDNEFDLSYVWATNDEKINDKITTENFIPGTSQILSTELRERFAQFNELNGKVKETSSVILENYNTLTLELENLSGKNDSAAQDRRRQIEESRKQLKAKLENNFSIIASEAAGSFPEFNGEKLDSKNASYIFYKPVLYRLGEDSNYVHGVVLIEISVSSLINQIARERNVIYKTGLLVVLLAIILAFISTYIIASRIVRPINTLVNHVAMIRDTSDMETLSGKSINIKTGDEIGILGDTVNQMTAGLVEAAVQAKSLTFGKEVQLKFLPLQTDSSGIALTYGNLKAKGADFFSYYAGADDLSGDYFDYKQLDENHYAIIKCDVSGHGVPAALIMVEVATLFLNYFKNWNMNNPSQGKNLSPVVGKINDLLESRGFKGRFAAFTLCILNTQTGECTFCNAGDNLVQVYDNSLGKKKTITLQETPAAGMFSTDIIDMNGGYKTSTLTLKKGDVLFLYTDGIEEAKRNFRDENFNIIKCEKEGLKEGEVHETHAAGDNNEEMTADRVTEIIESVFARKNYALKKFHCPGNDTFNFDFTFCEGTAEEAIMALVSIEKVFRMYKTSQPKITDRVKTDKKIDCFLKEHWREYSEYCSNRQEVEGDPTHIYYTGVLEDPQYDDLTLIAVKKN